MSLSIINPTSATALQAFESSQEAPEAGPTDCYRLLLFNGAGTAVLLCQRDTGNFLPEVRIPHFTRIAEQITSLLRIKWGLTTVLLFSGCMEGDGPKTKYAVLEECTGSWPAPSGMDWYPFTWAASGLPSQTERTVLRSSQAKATRQPVSKDPEPFSRLGWMGRLQEWIQSVLDPRGIRVRSFLQLNGSEAFSLIRFDTTNKPVWFKAVGKPNLHEFPVTSVLAQLFSDYLPTMLASDSLLNGWLMDSAGNSTLEDIRDLRIWRSVARRLAGLQIESIGHTAAILSAGCRDLRGETLAELADSFFDVIPSVMERQLKPVPAPLSEVELVGLRSRVKEALDCLSYIGIPETLGHCDLNTGNTLVDGVRCVFTDWAEGNVSHPFLTLEYLCRFFRGKPEDNPQVSALKSAYMDCWRPLISDNQIDDALMRAPLVAAFAYAVNAIPWRDPQQVQDSHAAKWLRGLTRQMHREAHLLEEKTTQ